MHSNTHVFHDLFIKLKLNFGTASNICRTIGSKGLRLYERKNSFWFVSYLSNYSYNVFFSKIMFTFSAWTCPSSIFICTFYLNWLELFFLSPQNKSVYLTKRHSSDWNNYNTQKIIISLFHGRKITKRVIFFGLCWEGKVLFKIRKYDPSYNFV